MTAGPISIQTLSLLIAPQTRGATGSTPVQSSDLDQDPDFCRAPVLHLGLGLCSGQPQSPAGHGPLTHHCHGTSTGEPPGEPPHRRSPQPAVQFVPITQRIDKKLLSGPTKCPPLDGLTFWHAHGPCSICTQLHDQPNHGVPRACHDLIPAMETSLQIQLYSSSHSYNLLL